MLPNARRLAVVLVPLALSLPELAGAALPPPPPTAVKEVRETIHGVEVADPYRWLEDQQSPETRAWIDAQVRYTDRVLADAPGREAIAAGLERLLKVDSQDLPLERGGSLFYSRRRADQEQALLIVRRPGGREEVLVDPHPLSADHTTSVSFLDITPDGKLVAYATREGGADEVAVTLLDPATLRALPDRLPKARYFGVQLAPDRRGVYYSRFESAGPRIYWHPLGGDPARDTLLFGEGYGPETIVAVQLSEDGRWLLATVLFGSAGDRTEIYAKDVGRGGPWTTIVKEQRGTFRGEVAGERLYLRTDWQADHGRIVCVDLRDPAPEKWKTVVPESDAVIKGFSLAGGRLFVNCLKNVASSVRVFDADGRPLGEIAFPALGTVGNITGNWTGSTAYFSFESFHIPDTIYRYDVKSGKQTEWWRSPAPVRSADYELRQVWYASKDGTRVPMFVCSKQGLALDGSHPTLLTGYGGFKVSETPLFSARAVRWMEMGGVFALPNLRGGGEFGEAWHKAGMLDRKQNVFDDFIGAAEWLIANRYTSARKLAITGGSNGGLLVGAFMTQRPELCRAVVCSVPLLDMLRYERFLVARFWVPEYGSAEDANQFEYLRAYSPYQHVKAGEKYPAVMFVTGDSDTRVAPLHARKMTALVQSASGSGLPVLLHYDTRAGHSGGKPVTKQVTDLTDELLFLSWQLGLDPTGSRAPAVHP